MGQPSPPSAPNYAQQYKQGIQTYLQFLPKLLAKEQQARTQYDPQRIEEQQALQSKYGPTQYAQQLAAWKQLDPQGYGLRQSLGDKISGMLQQGGVNPLQTAGYNQLGTGVESQYARGTQADPETLRQISQAVRSRQGQDTAQGNAQQMAEAVYIGQRGQQLQQQRTANLTGFLGQQSPEAQAAAQAGSYLSLPSAMSQMNQIQGVSPDRASAYVNPTAGAQGAQFGLQNYANQLGQYQAGGGSSNPWMNAMGGAVSGAAAGTTISPGYGTAAGALIGGLGGYFSSQRLKKDISKIGERNGVDLVEFRYKGSHTRYRGVIAEQVSKHFPQVVHSHNGNLKVDYDQLGIPFEKQCRTCKQFKNINDFQKRSNCESRDGHRNICIECQNEYKRDYYGDKHKDKWTEYHAKYYQDNKERQQIGKIALDLKCDYETAQRLHTIRQNATACDICGEIPRARGLFLDHCHETLKPRGILCHNCNAAIGHFGDDPRTLEKAIAYLLKYMEEV